MDASQPELTLPAQYNFTPLRALRVATRRKLSNFLDLEGNLVVVNNEGLESDVVNDYSGLAELAGFNYHDIMNMKRQRSATTELLDQWTTNKNGTVGQLWIYLHMMERYDVLCECKRSIVQECEKYEEHQLLLIDAEKYNIEQDPTVSTSEMKVDETKYATKQDVESGQRTFYDAFICYSAEDESDRKFLFMMIDELEKARKLRLFVPGRDDLPGSAEHTITAYLIEKRCLRVVILMSRQFLKSAACDFQVKFAHALAPGARSKKLIPIIREKNTPIPRILRFLAVCDFTKSDMVEWVWDRLYAAIIAPVGPATYFEEEDSHDPFDMSFEKLQDIKFPSQRRLEENEDDSSMRMDVQSGSGSRSIDVNATNQRQPVEYSATSMSWGQATSSNHKQYQSSIGSKSLPKVASGILLAKGATRNPVQQAATGSQKSKPVPAKKPEHLKGKKKKDAYQRQQPSTDSATISSSHLTEHFV